MLAVSIAAFVLMTASPIDPLKANVGQTALGSMSQEQIAKLEEYWGVGKPPVQRYLAWFRDFVRGDMGVSLLYRQKVTKVIAGGKERYDSVYQGLLACENCDYVFIHDGARPFIT